MKRRHQPWRDECFHAAESAYSLLNKVAWFNGINVHDYLRQCRSHDRKKKHMSSILLKEGMLHHFADDDAMPIVHGQNFVDLMRHLFQLEASEIGRSWRSSSIRICRECLKLGIHLRLHQHSGLEKCHIHGVLLEDSCRLCSATIFPVIHNGVPAFGCVRCKAPLIEEFFIWKKPPNDLSEKIQDETRSITKSLGILQDLMPEGSFVCKGIGFDAISIVNIQHNIALSLTPPHPALKPSLWTGKEASAKMRKIAGELTWETVSVNELQAAAKCVARWFMHRKGKSHDNCLDSPRNATAALRKNYPSSMFHPYFDSDEQAAKFCPVAIGFWLWRKSFAEWIIPKQSLDDTIPRRDVVQTLYQQLKSQLQYLIYASRKILDSKGDGLGRSGISGALESLLMTTFDRFSLESLDDDCANQSYICFDLKLDWCGWRCPGYEPYEAVFRHSIVSRPLRLLPVETEFNQYRVSPSETFSTMGADNFLGTM